ncbi:MAG: Gfo/Idh/MocA family oxidoreductase [Spirochaetes bacterium]|nr:Gfo/Idh/MocA family oxidoreductase [Spirochaetota bacterium]
MKKINHVIIGLGRIASLLEDDKLREKPCTHAGAIEQNLQSIIAGGCDHSIERREKFRDRWNCPHVYATIEELFTHVQCDILHIATHPDSHYDYVKKAIHYEVPVIVCEKPLADTYQKARKIVKLVEKSSTKLITNHERRYSNNYQRVKSLLSEKKYGDLLSISARLYMGRKKKIRDMLWHDGTHMVDIIQYLIGKPLKKPQIIGDLDKKKGTVYIHGKANQIPVSLEIGAGRDHLVFELDLGLSQGRIQIGNGVYQEYESIESPYYENFRSLHPVSIDLPEKSGYFSNMLADAVACLNEKDKLPLSSALDGFEVIHFFHQL